MNLLELFKNDTLSTVQQCFVCDEYRFTEDFWKRGKNSGLNRESRCKFCVQENRTRNLTNNINWKKRTYTKEEFVEAWNSSLSVSECARKLSIAVNSPTTRKTAKMLGLSNAHMKQLGGHYSKRSCEELFIYGKVENGTRLKTVLIEELEWQEECSRCGISEWLEQKAPLELDHINGNRIDNRLENLRFLCPNCHAFTETYRGRNIGKLSA